MDLTSLLLRVAARRPHVLVVPAAGGAAARWAVEASIARRGWPTATGPADADIVVVAGPPEPELGAVVERVWRQVPAPRALASVPGPSAADRELDAAATLLTDRHHQRSHVPGGAEPPEHAAGHEDDGDDQEKHDQHGGGHASGHVSRDGMDHDAHDGGGGHHDHGHEHSGHVPAARHAVHDQPGDTTHNAGSGEAGTDGGDAHSVHGGHHSHHGHHGRRAGMEMPGGLPMADLGEDRDGLTLDRLHLPLGPVLPDWPAGLVVRVTLQGDVIQEAAAELLDAGDGSPWTGDGAVRELDGLARFLGVTGWADAAAQSRWLRDALLAGSSREQIAAPAAALVRRVRRSRTLRWLVRGIPAGSTDVAGLLEQRLAAIEATVASGPGGGGDARPTIHELADLLVGAELAAARVIVAAVDPDTEQMPVREGARHG